MSNQATTWVLEFSESRGADRLVLFAIAHRVSNDDGQAFPSVKRIAREANLSERAVHYSIEALVKAGELEVQTNASRYGTNLYSLPKFNAWVQTLHPPGCKLRQKGVQTTTQRGAQFAPESSEENKERELSQERPREFATPEFEKFWKAYPYQIDRREAIREWYHVPFADKNLDVILAGLHVWRASEQWKEERYIPSPAKFLRMRRWESRPPAKAKRGPSLMEQLEELEKTHGLRR